MNKKNRANAYTNRGTAYAKKGEIDRAITDYTKAIADFRKALEAVFRILVRANQMRYLMIRDDWSDSVRNMWDVLLKGGEV